MSIIESLKYNIAHRFEFINSYSSNRLKEYISSGQIKPYIQWDAARKRVVFPQADLSDKSIILNEKFLEYLWMLIYSSWAIFEEDHMKREINETKGGNEIINRDIIKRAEDLRVFCRSFEFLKNDWPTELPNPQKPIELDKFYTERVNGIFIDSVALFLYHAFAHLVLGHTSTSEIDWVTSISKEKDADE